MTASSPATPRVSLALLVFIAFSGTLAMHIFVPAMPSAALSLGTDSQTIQMAITVYICGLALGMLIYGPVSDAVGRRPAILTALSVYLLGTICTCLATDPTSFLAARFVQALGGAGGLSLTRVIVADTSVGVQATRGLAILNLILLIGPGFAPVIGAQLTQTTGWRSIFVILSVMSLCTLIAAICFLPETGRPSRRLALRTIARPFGRLLRNKTFLRATSGGAFGSTTCYGYMISAPFILNVEMGVSIEVVGYCVGLTAAAAGSMLTRSIVGKVSDRRIMLSFSGLGALTGAGFLLMALAGLHTPISVVGLSLILLFSAGGMGPVTMGTALRVAGPDAGTSAGLFGCAQMVAGVICSASAGLLADHTLNCGLVLFLGYLFCFVQLYRIARTDTL